MLFSNCTPDNGAIENNMIMEPKSNLDLWLVTNTTLYRHSEAVQKRDNFEPSHLTCMTHVRHVSPKRVMHRFHYTSYTFNKALHMKKRGTLYEHFDIEKISRATLLGIGVFLKVKDYVTTLTI
jgi:hypothetical protein